MGILKLLLCSRNKIHFKIEACLTYKNIKVGKLTCLESYTNIKIGHCFSFIAQ